MNNKKSTEPFSKRLISAYIGVERPRHVRIVCLDPDQESADSELERFEIGYTVSLKNDRLFPFFPNPVLN